MRLTEAGETGDLMSVGRASDQVSPPSTESERYWHPRSVRQSIISPPPASSTTPGSCKPVLLPAGGCSSVLLFRQVLPSSSER
jgi:hypothetical protein